MQWYYESRIFRETGSPGSVFFHLDSIRFDSPARGVVRPSGIIHAPPEAGCNDVRMGNRSADLAPGHREHVRSICSTMHTNCMDRDDSRSEYSFFVQFARGSRPSRRVYFLGRLGDIDSCHVRGNSPDSVILSLSLNALVAAGLNTG